MLDIMTLYTTQRKQYVCLSDQSNHWVGTQQESGSKWNLALSKSFVTYDMPWLQTVEMIRILKKQFRRQNAVFICTNWGKKSNCFKSYCYPIYGCALWRHSYQNSIGKLTISYSDTFKRLNNVPRYTRSSLAFAMNATDHINVVFRKLLTVWWAE